MGKFVLHPCELRLKQSDDNILSLRLTAFARNHFSTKKTSIARINRTNTMHSLNNSISQYKKELQKGDIQTAYKAIMAFIQQLRNHLKAKYPDYQTSSNIYQGQLDTTYFSFSPKLLSDKKLKIVLLFIHKEIRFDVWLCGANKQAQRKYWTLINEKEWKEYTVPTSIGGTHSIVEHRLVEQPDFEHQDQLTEQLEAEIFAFTSNVLNFLSL